MTIKEVGKLFDISPDTLRYYERVGVIPRVARTEGGNRDYNEDDLKWVQNAICFRSAGLSIEKLIEYVKLFQMGDETFQERCDLLKQAKIEILENRKKYDDALEKLEYKISKYEEAVKTGELVWEDENIK
ncbi:MerR family transcriptional regulator [Fusobacterium sp. MFO224]|uniref:MerR family transcriptional regulator n=1 Tax=Fusobacterium sp. MFO224 TaxID=3378070 RepID=UPI003852AA50